MLGAAADLIGRNRGEPVYLHGRVLDAAGTPVAGATLDFWQAAARGLYWQQDPTQDSHNLRCRMTTNTDGGYAVKTIRPAPYSVPYDGPVGDLLCSGGRHAWRPAHFHFIVSAPGFESLVTEVFPTDDRHADEDAVFGVRAAPCVEFRRNDSPDDAARLDMPTPFGDVAFDFRLAPAR